MAYKDDAKNSARNFINIVYPKLHSLGWLRGELVSAEDVNASAALKAMDMEHGIDYINITPDDEYEGIASRVQYGCVYSTFTMKYCRADGRRDNTEYEKTKRHITNGEKHSLFSVHAYLTKPVDGGELLSVGMTNTTDIYDAIDAGRCVQKTNGEHDKFYSIKWADVPCKTWMRAPEYDAEWLDAVEKEGETR